MDAWKVSNTECDNEILNDDSIRFSCTDEINAEGRAICERLLNNSKFDGCLKVRLCLEFDLSEGFHLLL